MNVLFERRDFSGPLLLPGLALEPERLVWRAVGGPWSARIRASGDLARLLALPGMLRCGVKVFDAIGPAWWGYLSAVDLRNDHQSVRFELDSMANRVAVRYTPVSPNVYERPVNTAYQVDADSVLMFGEKELLAELPGTGTSTAAGAAAYALALLQKVSKPRSGVSLLERGGGVYAFLEGRGWWQTLDWKFYNQAGGFAGIERGGLDQPIGQATTGMQKVLFQMTHPGGQVAEIWLKIRCFRATDSLKFELFPTDPRPGGITASATITIPAAQLSDGHTWTRFLLPAPLDAATRWYVMLSRTGGLSDTNYYGVQVDEGLGDPANVMYLHNGSAWVNRAPNADMIYQAFGVEETTAQFSSIMTACGQFITETQIDQVSGVKSLKYRDGSRRGQEEAESLLAAGTSTGTRLLAKVDDRRKVRVFAQPGAAAAEVFVGKDGILRGRDGRALAASLQPAGKWVKMAELPPGLVLGNAGAVFAESVWWDGERVRLG